MPARLCSVGSPTGEQGSTTTRIRKTRTTRPKGLAFSVAGILEGFATPAAVLLFGPARYFKNLYPAPAQKCQVAS
jgi:hypothetical protein